MQAKPCPPTRLPRATHALLQQLLPSDPSPTHQSRQMSRPNHVSSAPKKKEGQYWTTLRREQVQGRQGNEQELIAADLLCWARCLARGSTWVACRCAREHMHTHLKGMAKSTSSMTATTTPFRRLFTPARIVNTAVVGGGRASTPCIHLHSNHARGACRTWMH